MIVTPIKTRIFREGDNPFDFVTQYIKHLPEESIVVVTSKIIALAERRTAVIENIRTKEKLIKAESDVAVPTKYVWLTIKDGMVMASAGIDESNAEGKLILLPKDSYKVATQLRKQLQKKFKVKRLGVILTDSRTMPLRAGVTGVALGYAGIKGIRDYRGLPDIFGRTFKFSQTNVADGLAAAAVLVMGEGAERYPLALIRSAPVVFADRVRRAETRIPLEDDMYLPFLATLKKSKD